MSILMHISKYLQIIPATIVAFFFFSCSNTAKKEESIHDEDNKVMGETPVKLTHITRDPMVNYIEVNATSTFLLKYFVKSNLNGYIQTEFAKPCTYVKKGQKLFLLKTKESRSLDSTISKLNNSFHFSGENLICSTGDGFLTQINHQEGDYVQDGEQLAILSDQTSLVFILNLPYEWKQYARQGSTVILELPDEKQIKGEITIPLSVTDPGSQTENLIIKIPETKNIPENLIAKVKLIKTQKNNVQNLPKQAILTNDIKSEFWVMQLIDSFTAVKVPIIKGLETQDRVEIISPIFKSDDMIILTGNYGLNDTAKVVIMQN